MTDNLLGLQQALSAGALIANVTGVSLGIVFGAMPGLTAAMGVALLIPLSFGMPPIEAFSILLGMYVGAIYGGSITAILVGTPGTVAAAATLLFQEHESTIAGIFASFFIANILMLLLGLIAVRVLGKIVHVPTPVLMSIVLTLCAVSSFSANNEALDMAVMAAFGLAGYLMLKTGFPQPPMLLAIILGPLAESNFRCHCPFFVTISVSFSQFL